MKPVSDFLPHLLPYVRGCAEPAAALALVDSAIAFCDESLALRQKLADISTVAGTAAYALAPPTDQFVSRVTSVRIDGATLLPVARDEAQLPTASDARPVAYYTTRVDSVFKLVLYPAPEKVYTLAVEVALRPTRSATTLQDDLFDLWIEPVTAGALGRLYAIPGQPFSDETRSVSYMQAALSHARKARIEGGFGRVRSTVAVRQTPFV